MWSFLMMVFSGLVMVFTIGYAQAGYWTGHSGIRTVVQDSDVLPVLPDPVQEAAINCVQRWTEKVGDESDILNEWVYQDETYRITIEEVGKNAAFCFLETLDEGDVIFHAMIILNQTTNKAGCYTAYGCDLQTHYCGIFIICHP
ncbi:TPA: hypothetical protein DD617_00260 [Candidatus Uhrbacteria bacterium]|nr:hypothetical protein [Candidatus Uhrbacteria bacterium]